MSKLSKWLCRALLCLCFLPNVQAADIDHKLSVLRDAESAFSIEQVLAMESAFIPWQSKTSLGYADATYWLRFDFSDFLLAEDNGFESPTYIRLLDSQKLVVLHYRDAQGTWRREYSGSSIAFSEWPVRDNQITFRIDNKLSQHDTFYLQVRSSGPMVIAYHLYDEVEYERTKLLEAIFWGVIIGIAAFAMLYNVGIWFYFRDPAYLYYILFCLSVISWDLVLKGYYRYLFPDLTDYDFIIAYINLNAAVIGMSIIQFMRKFVDFSRLAPRFDVFFKWVFWSYLLVILVKLLNVQFYLISSIMAAIVFISGVTAFVGLFIGLAKRDRAATFLALAWVPGAAIAVITVPTYYGYLPSTWLNVNMVPLASTVAIILFSVALGDKINTLRKQRDELQEKEYQRVLELSNRLKEVDRLKDIFLAKTSHELRTPLHGIIGMAEVLKRQEEVDRGALKSTLNVIIQSGKRLVALVNDILDFSKIKSGQFEIKREAVSLPAILNVVISMSRPLCNDKSLSLNLSMPEQLPLVLADENRIQQVLFNLIGNAIKFTNEGEVNVRVEHASDQVLVTVADTGMGISAQEMDQLFQPFQQGQRASEQHIIGTGIGLALTKQLVEMHDGELTIDSIVNRGTTIRFSLPVADATAMKAMPLQDTSTFQGDAHWLEAPAPVMEDDLESITAEPISYRARVLVVDDDPVNRSVIEGILQSDKLHIISCSNGQQALEVLQQNKDIDLILLDLMMPGISGFDVCQRIREYWSAEQLPIIFLSAKGQIDDINTGFKLGANDYMVKPFSADELLIRVEYQLKTLRVKQLFDSLYHFSRSIGKVKNLQEMAIRIANHCMEKFDFAGAVAVVDGEVCEQQGVFVINKLIKGNAVLSTSAAKQQLLFLDSDSDGSELKSLAEMLAIDSEDFHAIALVWDQESPSFLLLLKKLEQGQIAPVEKQYIRSLLDQSQEHFDNARALISDKYLFQAVNTIEEMLDSIVYIQSCPPYCTLHFDATDTQSKDVRANLSSLDTYLGGKNLVKVHRSYMVNSVYVKHVVRENRDYRIIVKDKSSQSRELPVARSRVKELKQSFSHWFDG